MKNMVLYGEGYTQEKKESKGRYELKKEYDHLDVVEVTHNDDNEIEKIVVENSYNKITFFRNKKPMIEPKTKISGKPTQNVLQDSASKQKQQSIGKGEPVDIFVIEEILQKTPSTKGLNAQKIYDKFEAQKWWNAKSNEPITAENIKFYIKKGWL